MSKIVKISAVVMLLALAFTTYKMPKANAVCLTHAWCVDGYFTFSAGDSCTNADECAYEEVFGTLGDAVLSSPAIGLDNLARAYPAPMCQGNICVQDSENYITLFPQTCVASECPE